MALSILNVMIKLSFLLFSVFLYGSCISLHAQTTSSIYVSPKGSDSNSGSKLQPIATLYKATQIVRNKKRTKNKGVVEIILRGGTYHLDSTLTFTPEDGGDSLLKIEYKAFPNEKVNLSGGKTLNGTWVKFKDLPNGKIWKIDIKNFRQNKFVFRSLYMGDRRLQRASSDTLFTKGALPQFAKSYKRYDFKSLNRLVKDSLDAFCGFTYAKKDLNGLKDINNAEITIYHSWDASWHPIYKIDTLSSTIMLKTPATYPVGFFGPVVGYRIENAMDYLDEPGEWALNKKEGYLFYFSSKTENPNKEEFIIPIIEKLISIKGDVSGNRFVKSLSFDHINFVYTSQPWGRLDGFSKTISTLYTNKLKWIDFNQGFASRQGALGAEESVLLIKASECRFTNCTFSHLGNYAIRIGEFSNGNIIQQCQINDTGAGGIIIGFNDRDPLKRNLPQNMSPANNKVVNCTITNIGVVHPSGIGIGLMQANHTLIYKNAISNTPYSGISSGWNFDFTENFNYYNTIKDNNIDNVMTVLADGGGIYTLGKQTGSIYSGNIIKNVRRSNVAVGSSNNGFFFDEGSSDFVIDSNVVMSVNSKDYRFNQTDSTKITIGTNYFEKSGKNRTLLQLKTKK
jgi:hypothetical protein